MRVALLTNFILPYRMPLVIELRRRCKEFEIFLSGTPDASRMGVTPWGELSVTLQRNLPLRSVQRHPHHFTEAQNIDFPYDTLPQLFHFRPDVIISGEIGLRTLQAALFRGIRRRSRLVIWATLSEATEQARGTTRSLLRRVLLGKADAVIVNGRSGAHYVERQGAPKERVFRAPQTTDTAAFLDLPAVRPESTRRRLLYAGRLIERKGMMPFLSHLADWARFHPHEEAELLVAGDGPLRGTLAAYPTPRNLILHLLGQIPYERLPEVHARSGILAFPTLADEWGMVVVEAMASGLPILGSIYSQAVEDLVVDGRTGWTFRPDQTDDVKSAIDRALMAPKEELDRMGLAARLHVREMTPAAMADQIVSAMEYALGNHS